MSIGTPKNKDISTVIIITNLQLGENEAAIQMRAEFTSLFPVVSATLNILGVHIYCFRNRGLSPRSIRTAASGANKERCAV